MKLLTKLSTPIYLSLMVALGAVVRFVHIAHSSIWHDEGYTMMLAPDGVGEIVMRTARDVHPPLYYIALHYWMLLFGTSEAAARSLSAVCMLIVIVLGYLLVKRLYSEPAGRLAALLLALAPFLVRYSQEARMYGMVAMLLTFATYALVRATENNKRNIWWLWYALAIAASLYTHYYTIFIILAHWIYMLTVTSKKKRGGLLNPWWWGSNVLAAALFVPWLPAAYAQFTRVQGSFWIPPVTAATLPNTMLQFLVFQNLDKFLNVWFKVGLALIFLLLIAALWKKAKPQRPATVLLTVFTLTAPVLVAILSFKRPIYIDRYFVFAAIGFSCLLAAIYIFGWPFAGRKKLQSAAIIGTLLLSVSGISAVYITSNHQMRKIGQVVNSQFKQGDAVLSGELYTFFDFSYYNHTGEPTLLWSKNGVNGYGESSLIYDRAGSIVVRSLADVQPASGYVWVVGKTGKKDYYTKIPSNWQATGVRYEYGSSAVEKFQVSGR